jgi:hypothetical protein
METSHSIAEHEARTWIAGTIEINLPAAPRGRICNRAGCGRPILGKDGRPRYDRNFCGPQCRRADKRERMQEKRHKAKIGRCPVCCRTPDKGCSKIGRVPRHNASTSAGMQTNQHVSEDLQTDRADQLQRDILSRVGEPDFDRPAHLPQTTEG